MRTHFKDNFTGFLVALEVAMLRKTGKAAVLPAAAMPVPMGGGAGGGEAAPEGAPPAKRTRTNLSVSGRAFIDTYLDTYIDLKGNAKGRAGLCVL